MFLVVKWQQPSNVFVDKQQHHPDPEKRKRNCPGTSKLKLPAVVLRPREATTASCKLYYSRMHKIPKPTLILLEPALGLCVKMWVGNDQIVVLCVLYVRERPLIPNHERLHIIYHKQKE